MGGAYKSHGPQEDCREVSWQMSWRLRRRWRSERSGKSWKDSSRYKGQKEIEEDIHVCSRRENIAVYTDPLYPEVTVADSASDHEAREEGGLFHCDPSDRT
jgi:hypothetical protein